VWINCVKSRFDPVARSSLYYLAGRLSGNASEQLRDTCDAINGAFVLDLSKLLFTDDAGIGVLRMISEQGARSQTMNKVNKNNRPRITESLW
jgi:anti-anti-sigma regulatory factor